jgi:uncharacterized protein (UPF0333 family)
MFKYLNKKKGQSTLEYAILIIIVIGALLSIQVYIKRGISGRFKSSADDIGDQYSVGNTNILKTVRTVSNTTETFLSGVSNTLLREDELTTTIRNSQIINAEFEYWGR